MKSRLPHAGIRKKISVKFPIHDGTKMNSVIRTYHRQELINGPLLATGHQKRYIPDLPKAFMLYPRLDTSTALVPGLYTIHEKSGENDPGLKQTVSL